ncbi:recombinase family protein [Heliorestis acidaminivorans]|uniref:Recombinase family protein n=1 Tax=Heliorestis acidaminivorans TaxID=553427 RepID=A0A6I0EZJ1_9FIRM|nr:recombinase family protein [Heliorestis acidaminivorans]KAB2951158.1 recombinase family protein [Heliorestis acidaminivorans]
MKQQEGKKVLLYCRVSTDEQAKEGVSLDEQRTRLKAYCVAMGWKVEIEEIIDDGYSAKDIDRPGLKRLLSQVEKGTVSRVLVTKLDRLSRRLLDLLKLIDLFGQHEVSFVSTSESFDTETPSGRLTLQVLGAVAEFERERIRERVIDNMAHAAKSGKWLTQHPYGYRLVEKELVVHEREAIVVRRIYDMFLDQGMGYFAIAKQLNEEGISSRQGKEWSIRSVKLVLTNPVYKGTLVWNRTDSSKKKRKQKEEGEWIMLPGALPAIVSEEKWDKVQEKINDKPKVPSRAKTSPHLLGGLLKCGKCGASMTISWSGWPKRHRVYRCSAYKNKGTCESKPYRADEVEKWFVEGLKNLVDSVEHRVREVVISQVEEEKSQKKEQKLRAAKLRYERKVEAYTAGLIELSDLVEEKSRLDEELRKEQDSGSDIDEVVVNQVINELKEKCANFIDSIGVLPVPELKQRLLLIVDRVVLLGEKEIEISLVV